MLLLSKMSHRNGILRFLSVVFTYAQAQAKHRTTSHLPPWKKKDFGNVRNTLHYVFRSPTIAIANKNETTTTYRWPMVCPSPQAMDRLWRQTIDKEAHIFPSLAKRNPNREARLRDGLDQKIEQQTHCTVDTARVLVEQQEFFNALA